jgi:hypothetical protein
VGELARYVGALSLVFVGVVHAQQYWGAYFYSVPTIGTLFLLDFIGATMLSVVLFAPLRRWAGRAGSLTLRAAAVAGIGLALGSLAALLVSEYHPLFGFMESGYRLAIVLALVTDGLAALFLTVFVLAGDR